MYAEAAEVKCPSSIGYLALSRFYFAHARAPSRKRLSLALTRIVYPSGAPVIFFCEYHLSADYGTIVQRIIAYYHCQSIVLHFFFVGDGLESVGWEWFFLGLVR